MSDMLLVLAPQILYEFYAVATRSHDRNGLGLTQQEALEEVKILQDSYTILPENEQILSNWMLLLENIEIKGKTTHDSKLVAYMLSHQIKYFYTLNQSDFKRYENNKLIHLI